MSQTFRVIRIDRDIFLGPAEAFWNRPHWARWPIGDLGIGTHSTWVDRSWLPLPGPCLDGFYQSAPVLFHLYTAVFFLLMFCAQIARTAGCPELCFLHDTDTSWWPLQVLPPRALSRYVATHGAHSVRVSGSFLSLVRCIFSGVFCAGSSSNVLGCVCQRHRHVVMASSGPASACVFSPMHAQCSVRAAVGRSFDTTLASGVFRADRADACPGLCLPTPTQARRGNLVRSCL